MSRRRRVVLLVFAAVAAGGLGVALVRGYSTSVSQGYGPLRPAVVATRLLAGGEPITPAILRNRTETRMIPTIFVPSGSLKVPEPVLGLEPTGPVPPGSYLTAGLFQRPAGQEKKRPRLTRGRVPVELTVSGAAVLSGPGSSGARVELVDVLVTREGRIGDKGRTSLAAQGVPLIGVGGGDPADAGPGLSRVVLGLTRPQAMDLIDAESFARRLTVLPGRRP